MRIKDLQLVITNIDEINEALEKSFLMIVDLVMKAFLCIIEYCSNKDNLVIILLRYDTAYHFTTHCE